MGFFWVGLSGLGLRGGRPLFAGIGFATLGWLAFLLFRFSFISLNLNAADSPRTLCLPHLFEAFAALGFGLLFRTLAEWRGGLTAAVGSGIAFGAVAFVLFQEAFDSNIASLLYFIVWGVFYGIIRLRDGRFLGTLFIQTLHSFTVWVALGPPPVLTTAADRLPTVYLLSGLVYLVVIWRLWPKEKRIIACNKVASGRWQVASVPYLQLATCYFSPYIEK